MWQLLGALCPCVWGPLECAATPNEGALLHQESVNGVSNHDGIPLAGEVSLSVKAGAAPEPGAGLPAGAAFRGSEALSITTSVVDCDISLTLEDAPDRDVMAEPAGSVCDGDHMDSLLASLLNSMAARNLTTCTSLETITEGVSGVTGVTCTVPYLLVHCSARVPPEPFPPLHRLPVGFQASTDTALLAKASNCDFPAIPAVTRQCEGSSASGSSLQRTTGSRLQQPGSQATAALRAAVAASPPAVALPTGPLPPLASPFNAVSAPFLDASPGDDRCSSLPPLCHARLGVSHSYAFAHHEAAAAPAVCIAALSGQEPLQRHQLSSRPSTAHVAEPAAAAAAGGAAAHAATATVAADTGEVAAAGASAAGDLLAGPSEPAALQAAEVPLQARPQVVASLQELLSDVDNLSPMASTAPALAPAAGVTAPRGTGGGNSSSAGAGACATVWQGEHGGCSACLHTSHTQ